MSATLRIALSSPGGTIEPAEDAWRAVRDHRADRTLALPGVAKGEGGVASMRRAGGDVDA
ncbi:MAG: hypothetical protein KDE27_10640 [Planctomycetes bacterium]|nr:hypothetical protein [Planctomycetota bacterium]